MHRPKTLERIKMTSKENKYLEGRNKYRCKYHVEHSPAEDTKLTGTPYGGPHPSQRSLASITLRSSIHVYFAWSRSEYKPESIVDADFWWLLQSCIMQLHKLLTLSVSMARRKLVLDMDLPLLLVSLLPVRLYRSMFWCRLPIAR